MDMGERSNRQSPREEDEHLKGEQKSRLMEMVEEKQGKEESVQFKEYTVVVKNTRVEINKLSVSLWFGRAPLSSPSSTPRTKKKQL